MRIAVAMSGGVDSSTVAAMLKRQGHDIIGLSMQLWNQRRLNVGPDGEPLPSRCCSLDDVYDARAVAAQFDFPFYVINLEEEFEQTVVRPFVEAYLSGRTPSPCIACNSHLKFARLVTLAEAAGADFVATGHYARVERKGSRYLLRKGIDLRKDQSYFLFELTQEQLARALFPLGEMTKEDVRRLAREVGLCVADKQESQEICFVPDGNYARFIERYSAERIAAGDLSTTTTQLYQLNSAKSKARKAEIVTTDGQVIGTHNGIHNYTIGQRRGLGIAWSEPLYVVAIDPEANRVVVGTKQHLPSKSFIAAKTNWIAVDEPQQPLRAAVRIRYRHKEAPATLTPLGDRQVLVEFDEPQRAITPGQAAVFYDGDLVIGGGWIESPLTERS
ncbi:MAG: tRNA 2-thiouridine(34) synthase MnmA [Acidobacteriota bacterium]|nr:tRNA 2-thiouridine(34) synthase MnmA [Blastocatellia bacterium]MDW8411243.1 tRNA 2-thiouridine(34) synthase MnmA [Acidobacteriota bacterium]